MRLHAHCGIGISVWGNQTPASGNWFSVIVNYAALLIPGNGFVHGRIQQHQNSSGNLQICFLLLFFPSNLKSNTSTKLLADP